MSGGNNGGTYYQNAEYAQINNGGSGQINTWVTSGTSLPAGPYASISVVAYNSYLYLQNGSNGSTYDASLSNSGLVGTWNTASTLGIGGLYGAEMTAYDGYLYIAGGESGATFQNTVYYASINGATMGSWTTSGSTFNNARGLFGFLAYNDYLYLVGGAISGNTTAEVDYASVNSNGSINAWTNDTGSPVPYGVYGAGVSEYDGYIYVVGGTTSLAVNTVVYAPINTNGSVGTWQYTTALPLTVTGDNSDLGLSVANGYMYVMGGCIVSNCSTYNSNVEYASINSNGTLGNWQLSANTFSTARAPGAVVYYNGFIYMLGGCDGSTCSTGLTDIQYGGVQSIPRIGSYSREVDLSDMAGPSNTPGTVNTWNYTYNSVDDSSSFTGGFINPRSNFGSVAYNGYLYVMGGQASSSSGDCTAGGNYCNGVEYAAINPDGTIGTWNYTYNSVNDGSSFTGGFANARDNLSATAYNGYMYITGGYDGTNFYNDIQYAVINSNGTIGTWGSTTGLPTVGVEGIGFTAYNGYLYAAGGESSGGGTYFEDESAPINGGGTVGTWTISSNYMITEESGGFQETGDLTGLQLIANNGYLYVIGGWDGGTYYDDVSYASISSGVIGVWAINPTYFNGGRWDFGVAIYNGYMYITGGSDPTTSTYYNDVQYAAINNSNGTLGNWQYTYNSSSSGTFIGGFYNARTALGTATYNGYLYNFGGYDGTNYYNDVQYASLIPSGADQDPQPTELVTTGTNAGNPGLGSVSGPGLGGVSMEYEFASNNCNVFTTPQYVNPGINNQLNSAFHISLSSDACSNTTNLARYTWVRFTLDDSQTAAFPDVNGNHTTLNNFTVYYNPTAQYRLRGGMTLTNGIYQSLNTNP